VVVRVKIADGWHVNANPASLAFLIPTRVEATNTAVAIEVLYPQGTQYHPRFSLEPLAVYEGDIDIRVTPASPLRAGAKLDLTFQACDDSSCLPPETLQLAVP
jgi:hypothetical protein